MFRFLASYIIVSLQLLVSAAPTPDVPSPGPNTVAYDNPDERTLSRQAAWFVLHIQKAKVLSIIDGRKLLPLPLNSTIFPGGFPNNTYPVIVTLSLAHDIRQTALVPLQISQLMQGAVLVPFVDALDDGKTPFIYPVTNYLGGYDGDNISPWLPAVVAALEGLPVQVSSFTPDTAPYTQIGTDEYTSQASTIILPNPLSGPGITSSALEFDFSTNNDASPVLSLAVYHHLLNQPYILALSGQCQRNAVYFNSSFADQTLRKGTITVGSGLFGNNALGGRYADVEGFSANGEEIGFTPQSCRDAAQMSTHYL